MKQIETGIEVAAPPQRAWEVLVDFERYPQRNLFIPSIAGIPAQCEKLSVRIQTPGQRGMTFRPRMLQAEPGVELRWLARLFLPGLSTASTPCRSSPFPVSAPGSCRASASEALWSRRWAACWRPPATASSR